MTDSHTPALFAEDPLPEPPQQQGEDQWLLLRPHDTVAPYRGWDEMTGAVPIWPSTIAGALASPEGLNGEPESVRGPVLARQHRTGGDWEAYFPVPADLYRPGGGRQVRRMELPDRVPGVVTDLDETVPGLRFFSAVDEHGEPETGRLTCVQGMIPGRVLEDYLHGRLGALGDQVPLDRLHLVDDPCSIEQRPRIRIDPDTRTRVEGSLHETTHLRLSEGWAFAAHLTPHPNRHRPLDEATGPVELAGQGRQADIEPAPGMAWPERPASFPGGRLLLYIATPGAWPGGWLPTLQGGDAALVSYLGGAPQTVSSASTRPNGRDSAPTQITRHHVVPSGAIYALEFSNEANAAEWAEQYHGRALPQPGEPWGRRSSAGFGVILTGVWP